MSKVRPTTQTTRYATDARHITDLHQHKSNSIVIYGCRCIEYKEIQLWNSLPSSVATMSDWFMTSVEDHCTRHSEITVISS